MFSRMQLKQFGEARTSALSKPTEPRRNTAKPRGRMLAFAASTVTALALCSAAGASAPEASEPGGTVPSDAPTAAESVKALQEATPEVLEDAAASAAEPPPAEQQAVGDVTTKIASDPTAGFAVDTPNADPLKIKPVGVESSAGDVKTIAGGDMAVATGTDPGVSTIIKPMENGISTYTVISGPESPERYTWDVGEGKTVVIHDDGHATVQSPSGEVVAHVPVPYAKTSDGRLLQNVRFEADGSRLTLVVPHRSQVTYYGTGVVADPWWLPALGTVVYFVGHKCRVGAFWALQFYMRGPWNPTVRGALGAGAVGCLSHGFKVWRYPMPRW